MLSKPDLSLFLKNKLEVSIIFICYLIFCLPTSPLFGDLGYDKEIFQYIGMAIHKGFVPYTDVFDHKPPVIFILNYLGYLLTPASGWGIFILINFLGFVSSLLLFEIGYFATKNKWIAVLVTICFIGLSNQLEILTGGGYTRQVTAFLTVFLAYILFTKSKTHLNAFLMGSIISIIFFTQQNEIISASVFVIAFIFFDKKNMLNRLFLAATGVVFIFSLLGLLLYYWGNFSEFVAQAFLFNITSYNKKVPFFEKMSAVIYELGYLSITFKVISVFLIFLIVNGKDYKKFDSKILLVFGAFLLQIISTSISGNTFGHYFLMFIPYLCLLFILSFKENHKLYSYSLIFILSLLFMSQVKTTYYHYINKGKKEKKILAVIEKSVSEVKNKPGQFYSFYPKFLRINFSLGITVPTKWVYAHFAYTSYDPNGIIIQQIIDSLIVNNTKYVLVIDTQLQDYPALKELMKTDYLEKSSIDELTLFVIKE